LRRRGSSMNIGRELTRSAEFAAFMSKFIDAELAAFVVDERGGPSESSKPRDASCAGPSEWPLAGHHRRPVDIGRPSAFHIAGRRCRTRVAARPRSGAGPKRAPLPPRRRWMLRAAIAAAGLMLGVGVTLLAGLRRSGRAVANEPSVRAVAPPAVDATPAPSAPASASAPDLEPSVRVELSHERPPPRSTRRPAGRIPSPPPSRLRRARRPTTDRSSARCRDVRLVATNAPLRASPRAGCLVRRASVMQAKRVRKIP